MSVNLIIADLISAFHPFPVKIVYSQCCVIIWIQRTLSRVETIRMPVCFHERQKASSVFVRWHRWLSATTKLALGQISLFSEEYIYVDMKHWVRTIGPSWYLTISIYNRSCFTQPISRNKTHRLLMAVHGSPLQWRHIELDGASNHQPPDCFLNRLFRCRSKKTSTFRVTGLCVRHSLVTGEFPAQRVSNAENVSIWCRHPDVTGSG